MMKKAVNDDAISGLAAHLLKLRRNRPEPESHRPNPQAIASLLKALKELSKAQPRVDETTDKADNK